MLANQDGLLAFAAGTAVGAGAIWWLTSRSQQRENANNALTNGDVHKLSKTEVHGTANHEPSASQSLPPTASGAVGAGLANFETDDILAEQLTRNVQFFGLEGQKSIANSFVVVIGLGGVGSHAAHLLLRSGVGRIRLVDFDQVTLSSLNRHCLATRSDVGLPKATCLENHFRDILPEAKIESLVEMYNDDTEEHILSGNPDFVLDAIDNIDTKVALLAACKRRGLPVLAVAGAGAKADPTRVRFVDIAESAVDPLARAVRHRLRRDHSIESGVTVLLSAEKPRCGLIFSGEEGANPADYQVIPNFRIRTIPVLGTTPAAFGLAAAGWILCHLAGQPIVPEPHFQGPPAREIQTQYDRLEDRERERAEREGRGEEWIEQGGFVGADLQEVEILIRELWRGRSARSVMPPATDMALTRGLGKLVLTRWDPSKGATIDNLVLLTRDEAEQHDDAIAQPGGFEALRQSEPEFVSKAETVLQRATREFTCSYY